MNAAPASGERRTVSAMLGRQALRLRLPYQRSFLALDRQQIAHQFGFCLFARFMRLRGLVVGFSIDLGIEPLYDSALALDIGRDFVVDIPSSTRPMTLMTLVPVIGVTRARA